MSSAYWTISLMATDRDLKARCKAAAAKEIAAGTEASEAMKPWMRAGGLDEPMWLIVARPDMISAWDYALGTERPEGAPSIGSDQAVIADEVILAAISAVSQL